MFFKMDLPGKTCFPSRKIFVCWHPSTHLKIFFLHTEDTDVCDILANWKFIVLKCGLQRHLCHRRISFFLTVPLIRKWKKFSSNILFFCFNAYKREYLRMCLVVGGWMLLIYATKPLFTCLPIHDSLASISTTFTKFWYFFSQYVIFQYLTCWAYKSF